MDRPREIIDYEAPRSRRSSLARIENGITLAFAIAALSLSILAAISGASQLERSRTVKGTGFRADARDDAVRMFAISGVLALPGLWYGWVAMRSIRREA